MGILFRYLRNLNKPCKKIYLYSKLFLMMEQNKRMNGIKEHILHLFYQFVNCIQHIVIV